jgi:hypothetical protein
MTFFDDNDELTAAMGVQAPMLMDIECGESKLAPAIVPLGSSQLSSSSKSPGDRSQVEKDKAPQEPCLVCGEVFDHMPLRCPFCEKHRLATNAMIAQFKKKKNAGDGKELDEYTKNKDDAVALKLANNGQPQPTTFSFAVLKFEMECPSLGPGKSRKAFSMVQFMEEHLVSTELRKGFKAIMMHKSKYARWAQAEYGWTVAACNTKFDQMVKLCSEDEQDENGPDGEKTRIPVHTEDFIQGSNATIHQKRMSLFTKMAKIKDEAQLKEEATKLGLSHADFSDPIFSQVGGNVAKRLGLGSMFASSSSVSKFGAEVEFADEQEQSTAKRQKHYALDENRNLTFEKVVTAIVLIVKLSASVEIKYMEAKQTYDDTKDEIADQESSWIVLHKRYQIWKCVIAGFDSESEASMELWTNDPIVRILGMWSDAVDAAIACSDLESVWAVSLSKVFAAAVELSETVMAELQRLTLFLIDFKWTGTEFATVPDRALLLCKIVETRTARRAQLCLEALIASKNAASEPLPIGNMESVIPLAALLSWKDCCHRLSSEGEVKAMQTSIKEQLACYNDLSSATLRGAKKVVDNVIKKIKDRRTDVEKEAAKAAKKQINDKDKEVKAHAKALAKQKNSPKPLAPQIAASLPHVLFTASSAHIYPLPTFPDPEALVSARNGSVTVDSSDPIVVVSVPALLEVAAEKSVKGSIGVFRVQFPASEQGKREGRGQYPLQNDRGNRIRELMMGNSHPGLSLPARIDAGVKKVMEQVSIYGLMPSMLCNGSFERQAVGNARYQIQGTREVILMKMIDLQKVAEELSFTARTGPHLDQMVGYMNDLNFEWGEDVDKALLKHKIKIFRQTIGPGALTYIPIGFIVCERVLQNEPVIGFRTSMLDSDPDVQSCFRKLVTAVAATSPDKDVLKAFLQKALLALPEPGTVLPKEIKKVAVGLGDASGSTQPVVAPLISSAKDAVPNEAPVKSTLKSAKPPLTAKVNSKVGKS